MYLKKLKAVRNDLTRNGKQLDWLCFIEKSYSVVGALTLASRLVSSMGIPACIYRSGYWNPRTKISGKAPIRGASVCIVYDMLLGGAAVLDAVKFLKRTFDANAETVVVFFEYDDKGGVNRLRDEGREILKNDCGVKLHSLLRLSRIKNDVDRVVWLYKELNHYGRTVDNLEERVRLISEAVKTYALSTGRTT
jgi:orotate phosphoribosyltransferase